jgi:hypothetical protein
MSAPFPPDEELTDAERALSGQIDSPVPLGRVAQITVLAIFGIIAAAQIAVSTLVLLLLIASCWREPRAPSRWPSASGGATWLGR